jgi:hypothetical protein
MSWPFYQMSFPDPYAVSGCSLIGCFYNGVQMKSCQYIDEAIESQWLHFFDNHAFCHPP